MQCEKKALKYEAIMGDASQDFFFFYFDSSTGSEGINMQQFICNETYVNIISLLAKLKFRLITLLANTIKDLRRPAAFCRNSAGVFFSAGEHIPETASAYVIDKDGKLIVFHSYIELKTAKVGVTATSSGQPWLYTSRTGERGQTWGPPIRKSTFTGNKDLQMSFINSKHCKY